MGLLQGVAQAKAAWKKRNAVPVSSKEAKEQRPTGRGGFGVGQAADRGAGETANPQLRLTDTWAYTVHIRPDGRGSQLLVLLIFLCEALKSLFQRLQSSIP